LPEKKTISFSVTIEEYNLINIAAMAKGSKPSGYCKSAVFSHLTKYPPKGIFVELNDHATMTK